VFASIPDPRRVQGRRMRADRRCLVLLAGAVQAGGRGGGGIAC